MEPEKVDKLLANEVRRIEQYNEEQIREELGQFALSDIIKYLRGRGYYVRVADVGYDERKFN
jgi:hypothetical protein